MRIAIVTGRKRTLIAAALLLAAAIAVIPSGAALAQEEGPTGGPVLINADREFVERAKDGGFTARPVFDRQLAVLHYGVRNADTGDWLTALYMVSGGERRRGDGWERSWEYPALHEQPDLNPDRAESLRAAIVAGGADHGPTTHYAVIPVHQPTGLWDRVLGALDPGRWARALALWVVEGVHGTLCGVVERASGAEVESCGA